MNIPSLIAPPAVLYSGAILFLAVLGFAWPFSLNPAVVTTAEETIATEQKSHDLLSMLERQYRAVSPIAFRENKGQVRDQRGQPRPDVLYSAEKDGLLVHFRADGLHYQLHRIEHQAASEPSALPPRSGRLGKGLPAPPLFSIHRVDVAWAGADTAVRIEAGEALPGYENYYNVPEGAAPALEVQQYRSLRYRGLYPGIDLHCYAGPEGGLKYDFIVQPGADYGQLYPPRHNLHA